MILTLIIMLFQIIATFLVFFMWLYSPHARPHSDMYELTLGPRIMNFEFAIDEPIIYGVDDDEGVDVHDSGIQRSLAQALQKLQPYHMAYDRTLIVNIIEKHNNPQIRESAMETLLRMEEDNALFQIYHERDVLMMVYNRLRTQKLDYTTLVEELADANGKCLVGRITRIVQSLESIDDIVTLKSLDLYKAEITEAFLNYRRKFLAKLPDNIQKEYETGEFSNDNEKTIHGHMSKYIDKKLRKQYTEGKKKIISDDMFYSLTKDLFINL